MILVFVVAAFGCIAKDISQLQPRDCSANVDFGNSGFTANVVFDLHIKKLVSVRELLVLTERRLTKSSTKGYTAQ
jgi:hypothetical protein